MAYATDMATFNTNMTSLGDEVRELGETTGIKTVPQMTAIVSDANDEIESQSETITQILEALQNKVNVTSGMNTNPLNPVLVYKNTRPSEWLELPEPNNNEIYMLCLIPEGSAALVAFTVTCTGNYTVQVGSVNNGNFVPNPNIGTFTISSDNVFYADLDWYGNSVEPMSDGTKQAIIKVSGESISKWKLSEHPDYSTYYDWNIVDISAKLPSVTQFLCGHESNVYRALNKLRYFRLVGSNSIVDATNMFRKCLSLEAVIELNTSLVTNMTSCFEECSALISMPCFDLSSVTNMYHTFYSCTSLRTVPCFDLSGVTNMYGTFAYCYSLCGLPNLDLHSATNVGALFYGDHSIVSISELDIRSAQVSAQMFIGCHSLGRLTFKSDIGSWEGRNLDLSRCTLSHDAILLLFNSLPTNTSSHEITLTDTPGAKYLTDAEKAIATNKNWQITI